VRPWSRITRYSQRQTGTWCRFSRTWRWRPNSEQIRASFDVAGTWRGLIGNPTCGRAQDDEDEGAFAPGALNQQCGYWSPISTLQSPRYSQTQSVMCHAVAHRKGMAKVGRRLLRQPRQTEPGRKRPRALSASAPPAVTFRRNPASAPPNPGCSFALNRCILDWRRAREHLAGRSGREASLGKTMRAPAKVCDRAGDPNAQ